METKREDIRNIAVIAYVDHGKITLINQLLRQGGVFRANQEIQGRVMDSNDLEYGKGITVLSKNTVVFYRDTKIDIIGTPRHADFGGEVGRVLKMMDDVVLIVDAYEGPMPQTKFVFQRALDLNLSIIVCINKIDRLKTRPAGVIDETPELIMDLDVADEQLDYPFIYASARGGFAKCRTEDPGVDMGPLFETIINHIPTPKGDPDVETQVLISAIDYNEFVDRTGIRRVGDGGLKMDQECVLANYREPDKLKKIKIGRLYEFNGLKRVEMQGASIGSIVAIFNIADIHISDTTCTPNNPESVPFQKISEPTIAMHFMVNNSPLAGQEGKFIASRHLRDRLFRELNTGVSLRVGKTDSADCFKVSSRGELHLSVLIENMRRKGFEFTVSKAEVLYKCGERSHRLEPMELAYVDVPEECTGVIIQRLADRKGALQGMNQTAGGYFRLEFSIPSRGPISYRGDFLTDTKGNGISNTIFDGYIEYKGDLFYHQTSSLVTFETGKAVAYGLFNARRRGALFIGPGVEAYSRMVVDQNPKVEDIEINVCRTKKLTNTRSSSADGAFKLAPPRIMSLEQALDFINTDELLEVTPESLRIRRRTLDPTLRERTFFKNKQIKTDIL